MSAKIYKIVNNQSNEIYIGSTTQKLCKRFSNHKTSYNSWKIRKTGKCMSYDLFDKYGIENCRIILIESFPCKTTEERLRKEQEHIDSTECINKIKAFSGIQIDQDKILRKQAYDKQYRETHNEKRKQKNKSYYDSNKDSIKTKRKIYLEKNKERTAQTQKRYQEKHFEEIRNYHKHYHVLNRTLHLCECGGKYDNFHQKKHFQTQKHQNFVKTNNEIENIINDIHTTKIFSPPNF
jgi:hypothetical protein